GTLEHEPVAFEHAGDAGGRVAARVHDPPQRRWIHGLEVDAGVERGSRLAWRNVVQAFDIFGRLRRRPKAARWRPDDKELGPGQIQRRSLLHGCEANVVAVL